MPAGSVLINDLDGGTDGTLIPLIEDREPAGVAEMLNGDIGT